MAGRKLWETCPLFHWSRPRPPALQNGVRPPDSPLHLQLHVATGDPPAPQEQDGAQLLAAAGEGDGSCLRGFPTRSLRATLPWAVAAAACACCPRPSALSAVGGHRRAPAVRAAVPRAGLPYPDGIPHTPLAAPQPGGRAAPGGQALQDTA